MQISHDTIVSTSFIYEQSKFWIALLGGAYGAYKALSRAFTWIKEIREKDLAQLTVNVDTMKTGIIDTNTSIRNMEGILAKKFEDQTTSIVDQLKELRSDFRTFYTIPQPQMIPARAKPVTKRKEKAKPRAKKKQ